MVILLVPSLKRDYSSGVVPLGYRKLLNETLQFELLDGNFVFVKLLVLLIHN
jgi:hypothetical protein